MTLFYGHNWPKVMFAQKSHDQFRKSEFHCVKWQVEKIAHEIVREGQCPIGYLRNYFLEHHSHACLKRL